MLSRADLQRHTGGHPSFQMQYLRASREALLRSGCPKWVASAKARKPAGRSDGGKTSLISRSRKRTNFEIPPGDDWVDFTLKLHYISCMIDKKPRRPRESAAGALARWESESGAPQPKSESNRETRAALAKEEEHVLRCLGAAVIMQWNDLPTQIQRDLFDHAISDGRAASHSSAEGANRTLPSHPQE